MERPSPARTWPITIAMGAIVLGSVAGVLLLARTTAEHPLETRFGFPGFQIPLAIVFGLAGTVILRRRPGNVIGTLLLAEGVLSVLQFLVEWIPRVLVDAGADASLVTWTSVIANVIWVPAVAVLGLLFSLYPDGHPISSRWAKVIPAILLGAVALTVGQLAAPGPLGNYPDVTNPLGLQTGWALSFGNVSFIFFMGPLGAAALSLLVRWRRSTGDARQQLKWLAFVAAPFVIAGFASSTYPAASLVMIGAGALIPVAIAIAVLRYRLYDIDELVSRTVVYGALTAILAGLYTAALKFFNELFVQVTGTDSQGPIILATLVLAAAFTPIRKALEGLVERRFKSTKGAAAGVTASTSGGAVPALDMLELEGVVRRAMREELAAFAAESSAGAGPVPAATGIRKGTPQA